MKDVGPWEPSQNGDFTMNYLGKWIKLVILPWKSVILPFKMMGFTLKHGGFTPKNGGFTITHGGFVDVVWLSQQTWEWDMILTNINHQ